ncbi:MAG: DMT family transporter [Hyphomicrobiales bacterium]
MSLQATLLTLVALIGGGMIALQAPINAEAASRLGNPIAAATMSFCVGLLALVLITMLFARQTTDLGALKSMPLYMLIGGGLLGAMYVTITLMLAPRIGVAAVMALGIAGQLFTALLLDRFGMFDLIERGLTTGRVGGAVLVLVGALMVRLL